MALKPNNGGSDGVQRVKPPLAPRPDMTGPQKSEYSMVDAVELAALVGADDVDEALGIAAAAGRFADGDVAAIVRHLATGATGADLVIADEAHSVQPGTGAWAGFGTRKDTAR